MNTAITLLNIDDEVSMEKHIMQGTEENFLINTNNKKNTS